MSYIKPEVKSYTACGIIEELGPGQMQYEQQTVTLNPTATSNEETDRGDLDGCIIEDSIVCTNGIFDEETIGNLVAVNNEGGGVMLFRSFLGFDISSIQSTIVSAKLKIYQGSAEWESGVDSVVVDHVNFGDSLDLSDFDITALSENIGTLSTDTTAGWKPSSEGMDVTQYVQDDVDNGRDFSQFRIRVSDESGGEEGQGSSYFADSEENLSTNKPTLEITYY